MANYSEMSDFEINKKICDIFWPELPKSDTCLNKHFPQHDGRTVYLKDGYGGFSRDYCNSWADAGPIIEKNRITLAFDGLAWQADSEACWVDGAEWQISGETNQNPLRAAMIVFLMMQEAT